MYTSIRLLLPRKIVLLFYHLGKTLKQHLLSLKSNTFRHKLSFLCLKHPTSNPKYRSKQSPLENLIIEISFLPRRNSPFIHLHFKLLLLSISVFSLFLFCLSSQDLLPFQELISLRLLVLLQEFLLPLLQIPPLKKIILQNYSRKKKIFIKLNIIIYFQKIHYFIHFLSLLLKI